MPNNCDIILVGHAGGEAKTATTQSGHAVANFSIAYNVNKNKVIWVRCVCWGDRLSEKCEEISKGDAVKVYGRITSDRYEKDGVNGADVPQIEITCESVAILPKYQKDKQAEPESDAPLPGDDDAPDDDLPF